ncbi:MAG: preprotein translocase subunit SecG [Planctomycetota bacterium]|jgi:preprotein translocase subunit SecG
MSVWFTILTIIFILVSAAMVLIILVQRPQGGGLAGAFGGAGGGTDTVFGGRVGDALTVMTVIAFVAYLSLAVGLNLMDSDPTAQTTAVTTVPPTTTPPADGTTPPGGTVPPTGATPQPADPVSTTPPLPDPNAENVRGSGDNGTGGGSGDSQ